MINLTQLRLWLPMITGFGISVICKMKKNEGVQLPQRPPAYVFGIVWPILYLLLGYSWVNSINQTELDMMHGICTLLLTLWLVFFSCMNNKKMGIYIIASLIATVVCCMSLHNHILSTIALTPLLGWLLVAFLLNWNIVK